MSIAVRPKTNEEGVWSAGYEQARAKDLQIIKRQEVLAFNTEDEEREFWATHDSTELIDWSKAKRTVFPNLKPSTKTISLRLPESIIASLNVMANKRDKPYQSTVSAGRSRLSMTSWRMGVPVASDSFARAAAAS